MEVDRLHSFDELKDILEVKEYVTVDVEFPFDSKVTLTNLADEKFPGLPNYPKFIFTPEELNFIEENKDYVSDKTLKKVIERLIYERYKPNDTITIHKVRLSGEVCLYRARVISSSCDEGLKLKVGEDEIRMKYGSWVSEHYTKNGEIIYSVNTPTEFFKGSIYHWDLEVDVVKSSNGNVKVINQEKLRDWIKKGVITSKLANRALRKASEVRNLFPKIRTKN